MAGFAGAVGVDSNACQVPRAEQRAWPEGGMMAVGERFRSRSMPSTRWYLRSTGAAAVNPANDSWNTASGAAAGLAAVRTKISSSLAALTAVKDVSVLALAVSLALTGLPATSAAGAVTLVGSPSGGHNVTTSLTVSHTNVGDYLVVAVLNLSNPEATAVTYNGVSMTRLNVAHFLDPGAFVIMFGLAAPASGTHDVVVTDGGNSSTLYLIAQSFSGVHQTRPALSAGGQWQALISAPLTATVPSAAGWKVLDATWTDANHGGDLAPGGSDNTLVSFEANGFGMGMSSAPGAASVTMEWTWTGTTSLVQSIVQLRPATDDAPDVTLDNAGASAYAASTTTADATVTVGPGTNRALTVGLVFDNKSVSNVSVVYDPAGANQALALIKSEVTTGSYGRAELWGLIAPATGTSKTVRVSWTGSSSIVFSATSWTNVDQTGGTATFAHATSNTGVARPTTVQVTSGVHDVTIDSAVCQEGFSDVAWPGQATLFHQFIDNLGTNGTASAYQRGSATGYHRMVGSLDTSAWAMVGCDIVAVGSGGCTPPATPTITPGGPTTFCAGGSVTLASSSPTGNQWYVNGNPIGGATAQQYLATASGGYTVTVTASGCTSAPSAATTVTVNPIPSTPVITAPSTVAPGSPNHTASVPSNLGSTYAWSISNGTITNGQGSAQITFTAGSNGTLTLSVVETSANGCVSQSGTANVNVGGTGFYTLTPCRLLDTRNSNGPYGGPAMAALSSRTFVAAGRCGIPSGAISLSINITVTQGTASGNVLIYRTGIVSPQVPIIDYRAAQTRANNGILGLGAGDDFVVESGQPTGTVHVIVDVNGYFQ
jgi:hypothetical protein